MHNFILYKWSPLPLLKINVPPVKQAGFVSSGGTWSLKGTRDRVLAYSVLLGFSLKEGERKQLKFFLHHCKRTSDMPDGQRARDWLSENFVWDSKNWVILKRYGKIVIWIFFPRIKLYNITVTLSCAKANGNGNIFKAKYQGNDWRLEISLTET